MTCGLPNLFKWWSQVDLCFSCKKVRLTFLCIYMGKVLNREQLKAIFRELLKADGNPYLSQWVTLLPLFQGHIYQYHMWSPWVNCDHISSLASFRIRRKKIYSNGFSPLAKMATIPILGILSLVHMITLFPQGSATGPSWSSCFCSWQKKKRIIFYPLLFIVLIHHVNVGTGKALKDLLSSSSLHHSVFSIFI